MNIESRLVSSLEKVFCDSVFTGEPLAGLSVLKGERISFQIAVRCDRSAIFQVSAAESSGLEKFMTFREVQNIPSLLPAFAKDEYTLRTAPGLFPDALTPIDSDFVISANNWHAVWVSLDVPADAQAGMFKLKISLKFTDVQRCSVWCKEPFADREESIDIEIIDAVLPEQKLKVGHWFYADCILHHYRVEAWSEEHWALLEKYFRNFADHRNNMLLTPLWSVQLDIIPGVTARPVCQLLKLSLQNGRWSFGFDRLERWISTARKCGIRNFEMIHTFSQWGLKYAQEIMVESDGVERPMFGTGTAFDSPEYAAFLRALMSELLPVLKNNGLTPENCYFHISDEPGISAIENYRYASKLIRELVGDYPVIDALSHVEFLKEGLIECPVPHEPVLEKFMAEKVRERWVYYAGAWENGVPGRMFGMPSLRNRVLGVLLYVYGCDGFLEWGYNFWFGEYSRKLDVDPWKDSNSERCFMSGGAFLVYPGSDGPVDSLRHEVIAEGFCDEMALRLLESKTSRAEVLKWLDEETGYRISLNKYPRDEKWLLDLRYKLNQKLAELHSKN